MEKELEKALIETTQKLIDTPKSWNPIKNYMREREATRIVKAIGEQYLHLKNDVEEAEKQGSMVNDAFQLYRVYESVKGVREKTNVTFALLKSLSHHCEPLAAIIETRVQQCAQFANPCTIRRGRSEVAGFRIRMSHSSEEATQKDLENMAMIEQFVLETGFTEPPIEERPVTYQPGFENFIRQIVRDTLVYDWVAVRKWKSAKNPKKFPIVAFTPIDASKIRKVFPNLDTVGKDGVPILEEFDKERKNTNKDIKYVMVTDDATSVTSVNEFTDEDLFVSIRNPRTDEYSNGYGYSEAERGLNAINIWLYGRNYNAERFRKDALPRGFLTIVGNVDNHQLTAFQIQWKQYLEGFLHRWAIPILKLNPGDGASVNWTPMDMSSRDMEYSQFMFMVSIWLHALYQIHPAETGYQELNPLRPTMGNASPEAQLKYSYDKGLNPILRWIESFMNREIIWKLYPNRRYRFEFVGLGEYDEMADIQKRLIRLQAGLSTPEMEWNELDIPIPELWKNHPAIKLPMPIYQGFQFTQQTEAQAIQIEQNKLQMMNAVQQSQQGQRNQNQQNQPSALPAQPEGSPSPQGDSSLMSSPEQEQQNPMNQPNANPIEGGEQNNAVQPVS